MSGVVSYARAGAGELHTRPLFNLKTPEGLTTFRGIATDVAALAKNTAAPSPAHMVTAVYAENSFFSWSATNATP